MMTDNPLDHEQSSTDVAEVTREADNTAWLEDLTVELRLLDVSGTDIGDAVASAREFLADSGTTATESFGGAADYAAELQLPALPQAKSQVSEVLVTSGIGIIGLVVLGQAVWPLAGGDDDLTVKVYMLVSLAVTLAVLPLLPRVVPMLLRARTRPLVFGMIMAGVVFGGVGPVVLSVWQGQGVVFTVPALPVAIAAGAALLAPAIWNQMRQTLRADPIVEPGAEAPKRPPLWVRLFLGSVNWMMVFYGFGGTVLTFVLYPDQP